MSNSGLVGEFLYTVSGDRWWWSDDLYRILGFTRGEVVPTTELLRAHLHPDDAARVRELFSLVLQEGGRCSCYFKIFDASRSVRHAVAVGEGHMSPTGVVTGMHGYLVDLTKAWRRDLAAEADAAVRGATQHRAVIEQAKGALMFVYGVDSDTAFAILSSTSQHSNIKLHQVAARLMAAVDDNPHFPAAGQRMTGLLRHLSPCGERGVFPHA